MEKKRERSGTGGTTGAGGDPPEAPPLAYLITFTCYGAWLHGSHSGSVDRSHNIPGMPLLSKDPARLESERRRQSQPQYELDAARREIVLRAIKDVCAHRGWSLLAAQVRTKHVHAVVRAADRPERVMNDFKTYASRRLAGTGLDREDRKRWTRHGSTRYLWNQVSVMAAIRYVLEDQGKPMAAFEDADR